MKLNPGKEAKLNYFSLYFAFSVPQVIRIWKEEDLLLDKTFRATVSFGGLHLSSQVSLELNPGPLLVRLSPGVVGRMEDPQCLRRGTRGAVPERCCEAAGPAPGGPPAAGGGPPRPRRDHQVRRRK